MIGWRHFVGALVLATMVLNQADAFGWSRAAPSYRQCYTVPAGQAALPVRYDSGQARLPVLRVDGGTYPATYGNPGIVPLAIPTAAPPSASTPEPPLIKKVEMPPADKGSKPGPTVIEVRSINSALAALPKDRCRVGFWNLSGRDVSLAVAGKTVIVPRDRAITLELPRDFMWRVDAQPVQTERVADDKPSHDVVIR